MGGKPNPVVRNFLLGTMFIGFVVIALGQLEDVEDVRDIIPRLSTFEIISVEQDPITGEITGAVVLGKPIIAGYGWTGAPNSPKPTCH